MDSREWLNKLYPLLFGEQKSPHPDHDPTPEIEALIKHHGPAKLFRYRSVTRYNIEAFRDDMIYAVQPALFNDPYDSLPFCRTDHIMEKLEETARSFELEMDQDSREQIYGHIKRVLNHWQSLINISCFSESYNNMLMWSHYADNHKGFMLEYDIRNWDIFYWDHCGLRQLLPVFYSNRRYDATFLMALLCLFRNNERVGNMGIETLIEKTYLVKAADWNYEKEWRLFIMPNKPEKMSGFVKPPTAIYYGTRMDKSTRDHLRKIAATKDIVQYQMTLHDDSPSFDLDHAVIL